MAPGDTEAKLSTWELGEALYHSRSVFDQEIVFCLSAAIGMRTPYSDLAELFEINNHNISLRLFRPEKSYQGPGTYSPRHADPRLLAIPTSCRRVAAYNPNWGRFWGFAPPRGLASLC